MFCPSCKHENRSARKLHSGAGLDFSCPSCGASAEDPADKILQSKSALEGERKQVSVLFAEVKGGSTAPRASNYLRVSQHD